VALEWFGDGRRGQPRGADPGSALVVAGLPREGLTRQAGYQAFE
jgi:hypothetical protein